MNNHLILLTTAFPYGYEETYLETEVKYYDEFEDIQIFPLNIYKNQKKRLRGLPSQQFKVFPVFRARGFIYILYTFVAFTDKNLYTEILRLIQKKRFSCRRLVRLLIYLSRSHYEARKIAQYLKKNRNDMARDDGIIYAYRVGYQAYVGTLIKKYFPGYSVIARGHGSDLYEENNNLDYIPMQELLMRELDKIVVISDNGKKYLSRKYPKYKDKIVVSRLGTATFPVKKTGCPNGVINIVSCSNVVSIKRLELIVKSLALIDHVEIYWTHYGDGDLLGHIKNLCKDMLSSNITYDFRGSVSNEQILKDYSEKDYHLFLNVSSSEGIPVSIMEAASFGIPCIATDVGGTGEIIKDGENGMLLNLNFDMQELANDIEKFAFMRDEQYQGYRKSARSIWEEKYCAEKNYPYFVKNILQ